MKSKGKVTNTQETLLTYVDHEEIKTDGLTELIKMLKRGKKDGHEKITTKMVTNLDKIEVVVLWKLLYKSWEKERTLKTGK